MDDFPVTVTIGEKYRPAMEIKDHAAADAYFEKCVAHTMARRRCDRDEAERIERSNLGYFAGYYDIETQERVQRLYHACHPVFGPVPQRG